MIPLDDPRMTACVCYSGEMRAFEGNFKWTASCEDWLAVDSVLATWSGRGGKIFGHLSQARMRSVFPDRIYDAFPPSWIGGAMHDAMPGLRARVSSRAEEDRITEAQVRIELPDADIHIEERLQFRWFERPHLDDERLHAMDPFSMQMLYKIWQADLMRRNLENRRGKRYDIVIRARPDRPIVDLDQAVLRSIRPGQIYLNYTNHEKSAAGDFFAVGDSKTMDIYGEYFLDAYKAALSGNWHVIHSDMYHYLMGKGIELLSYDPMADFAPERMVILDDVLAEIKTQQIRSPRPPPHIWSVRSPYDAEILANTLRLVQQLTRGTISLNEPEFLDHLDRILGTFEPQRDCGLFFYMLFNGNSGSVRTRLDAHTQLIVALIASIGLGNAGSPDYDLFTENLTRLAVDFAVSGRPIAANPEMLINRCLNPANATGGVPASAIAARLLAFISVAPQRAKLAGAAQTLLATLKPALTDHLVGAAARISGAGDHTRAEIILRNAIEFRPDSAIACVHLSLSLAALNRPAEAAAMAMRGAELAPDDAAILNLACVTLIRARALNEAEQIARKLAVFPECPPYARTRLIDVLIEGSRTEEAIQAARQAVARYPDDTDLQNKLNEIAPA